MNYRHAFHAGNFADVFKHALLTRMLVYLMRKEQPLRYIDTHAGIGRYNLAADESSRTGEWRSGIARVLLAEPPEDIAALLAPWLDAIGAFNADGRPALYPGSPALASTLLRPQDKIALNELHEKDSRSLSRQFGNDERVRIDKMDGYTALNAWTPPVERRGLVLIDPPFEDRREFDRIVSGMAKAWKKWPTGTYAIWYPVKDAGQIEQFYAELADIGIKRILRLEMAVDHPSPDGALCASGLCVINPAFTLIGEARTLLPWLAGLLGHGGRGSWTAVWAKNED